MSWVPDFSGGEGSGGGLSDFLSSGDANIGQSVSDAGTGGADFSQIPMGDVGGTNGLAALSQFFLSGNNVPEVQASSPTSGAGGSPFGSLGSAQGGGSGVPDGANRAADSQKAYEGTPAGSQEGFLQKVMRGLGLSGKNGSIDLSDPKQLQQWMRLLMAGGGVLQSILQGHNSTNHLDPQAQLARQGGGALAMGWNPAQQASANAYFNAAPTPWNQRSVQYASHKPGIVVSGYAHGGPTQAGAAFASEGALGKVAGGQDDVIDAALAPGEFVWDADTVSALGDGDNTAGAHKLEQARQEIRKHKRSAPPDRIPPRAKPLSSYLKGGK